MQKIAGDFHRGIGIVFGIVRMASVASVCRAVRRKKMKRKRSEPVHVASASALDRMDRSL